MRPSITQILEEHLFNGLNNNYGITAADTMAMNHFSM